jgi:NAD(P)-dependent dehydrogenase (short-subunit alcohol dehydrogenase family)
MIIRRGYGSPMKSAFIAGAGTGIGEALVVRLQHEGWQVFAAYRDRPPEETRWFGKPNTAAVRCDVTQSDQVAAAATTVSEHTGGTLDLLINNAGYSPRDGVIEAAEMTEYRHAFEVNFRGPMQVLQTMTPLVRRSEGRIINTTSASVYINHPDVLCVPDVEGSAEDHDPTPPYGVGSVRHRGHQPRTRWR